MQTICTTRAMTSLRGRGYRGKKGAERLLKEIRGAFSGGEMAEEDMDELMLAIQEAYIDAKKRNKKYTPKKYRKQNEEN